MKDKIFQTSNYVKSYTFYYGFCGFLIVVIVELVYILLFKATLWIYLDIYLEKLTGIKFIPTIVLWTLGFGIGTIVGSRKDKKNIGYDVEKLNKE